VDEPTSGLDSFTSYKIINTLKNICHEQNRTIYCTIHQPSSELFGLFDDCIFLTAGELMYSGKINSNKTGPVNKLGSYLKQIGYPIPQFSNPADHMLNLVSNPSLNLETEYNGDELDEKRAEKIFELAGKFKKCDLYIPGE
jgi:ATP-binding cassette, subfamily G (WHITE), member 2